MVENRPAFLRNVVPALKPGGKVAVIEFYRREAPVGPPLWARLSEAAAGEDFLKEAFKLDRKLTFLPYQYLLRFTKYNGGRVLTGTSCLSPGNAFFVALR